MNKRINITLPEETIGLLDRAAKQGGRSSLIDTAVRHYLKRVGRARLENQMAEGYRAMAAEDTNISMQWDPLSDELWQKLQS